MAEKSESFGRARCAVIVYAEWSGVSFALPAGQPLQPDLLPAVRLPVGRRDAQPHGRLAAAPAACRQTGRRRRAPSAINGAAAHRTSRHGGRSLRVRESVAPTNCRATALGLTPGNAHRTGAAPPRASPVHRRDGAGREPRNCRAHLQPSPAVDRSHTRQPVVTVDLVPGSKRASMTVGSARRGRLRHASGINRSNAPLDSPVPRAKIQKQCSVLEFSLI